MRKISLAFVAILAACGGETPTSTAPTTSASAATSAAPSATTTASASGSTAAVTPPPADTGPKPLFHLEGFQTPESVAYDDANDRYLVSNINGKPGEADNNGYISLVSPDGKIILEKFIAGGVNKVTLHAPKGTAIANGMLYVADIDTVRKFDLKTGAPKGEIKIPGATFLNDVDADADGNVYVSDTGIKFGAKGPEPTGTDAVYVIDKTGKIKTLAKAPISASRTASSPATRAASGSSPSARRRSTASTTRARSRTRRSSRPARSTASSRTATTSTSRAGSRPRSTRASPAARSASRSRT